MLVKKGTFVFNCINKGNIPMVLEKCSGCKFSKKCKLQKKMKMMESDLEHDTRYEMNDNLFQKIITG